MFKCHECVRAHNTITICDLYNNSALDGVPGVPGVDQGDHDPLLHPHCHDIPWVGVEAPDTNLSPLLWPDSDGDRETGVETVLHGEDEESAVLVCGDNPSAADVQMFQVKSVLNDTDAASWLQVPDSQSSIPACGHSMRISKFDITYLQAKIMLRYSARIFTLIKCPSSNASCKYVKQSLFVEEEVQSLTVLSRDPVIILSSCTSRHVTILLWPTNLEIVSILHPSGSFTIW